MWWKGLVIVPVRWVLMVTCVTNALPGHPRKIRGRVGLRQCFRQSEIDCRGDVAGRLRQAFLVKNYGQRAGQFQSFKQGIFSDRSRGSHQLLF